MTSFDGIPGAGGEIRKTRPALVLSPAAVGRMQLRIVVPITRWQPQFANHFWLLHITPSDANGLSNASAAAAFQVRSSSLKRFQSEIGVLTSEQTASIAAAVALCIEHQNQPAPMSVAAGGRDLAARHAAAG